MNEQGPKPGRKPTPQEIEAGRKNLEKWKSENPSGENLTHGAHSSTVRQRYSDRRTTEGDMDLETGLEVL